MNKSLLKEALELTPAERVELVGEIWDQYPADRVCRRLRRSRSRKSSDGMRQMIRDPGLGGSKWEDVEAACGPNTK